MFGFETKFTQKATVQPLQPAVDVLYVWKLRWENDLSYFSSFFKQRSAQFPIVFIIAPWYLIALLNINFVLIVYFPI